MNTAAKFVGSFGRLQDLPADDLPQIALLGRSNVGKSSLVNHLTNQNQLARTSSSPGRTQTLNFYEIGGKFYLVDLPGYGYTVKSKGKDEAFVALITDYLQDVQDLQFAFLIIDASVGLTKLDGIMSTFLTKAKIPFAIILNKTDKGKSGLTLKLARALAEEFPGVTLLPHAVSDKSSRIAILEEMERVLPRRKVKSDTDEE